MIPFPQALESLGLSEHISVLPVQSGYPSPKNINLVLRRHRGTTYLFESSAARPDIVDEIRGALGSHSVSRLDALLVTHCHGDHAGSSGIVAGFGRPDGERAPIYLHSAGYRFLTHPEAAFLNETYELFLTRSHWGLLEYNQLSDEEMVDNAIRKRFAGYFAKTPKSALRFVDKGQLPEPMLAVPTPGHSWDCVLYYDPELEIAVPGDTIICTGLVDRPETQSFVIPIFTVAGQSYSMAWERYTQTIRLLRRFFSTHRVRAVLPPHGKFAVTEPRAWVEFAESYFKGIYRALCDEFLSDSDAARSALLREGSEPLHPERRLAPHLDAQPRLRNALRPGGRGLPGPRRTPAHAPDFIPPRADAARGLCGTAACRGPGPGARVPSGPSHARSRVATTPCARGA